MPETDPPQDDPLAELRARADALEKQLGQVQREAEARLVQAELKAEALRSGIVDLDGLKLLDPASVKLNERGEVEGVGSTIAQLKRTKPWLFAGASSSSPAAPPPVHPPRQKRASEMTDAEYRAARAELLKRHF